MSENSNSNIPNKPLIKENIEIIKNKSGKERENLRRECDVKIITTHEFQKVGVDSKTGNDLSTLQVIRTPELNCKEKPVPQRKNPVTITISGPVHIA